MIFIANDSTCELLRDGMAAILQKKAVSNTAKSKSSKQRAVFPITGAEIKVLQGLRKIIRAVDMHSKKLAAAHGITGPQLLALQVLQDRGPTTQKQLGLFMNVGGSTITGIVDRLEIKRLVFRQRDTVDRRKVFVTLAKKGLKLLDRAPTPLQEAFALKFAALSDKQKQEIARSIQGIVALMGADDIDASPILTSGEISADKS